MQPLAVLLVSNLLVAASQTERGSVSVTVAGEDIVGLVIALHKGSTVSGQIEFEGESRPALTPAMRIYASEAGGSRGMNLPGTSTINPDWSFEIAGVSPGKRLFRLTGLPPTHVLKSVTVGGEDVTDAPTEFDGKGMLTDVKLLLTERVTSILSPQCLSFVRAGSAGDPTRMIRTSITLVLVGPVFTRSPSGSK
jgi:hypothetical protein